MRISKKYLFVFLQNILIFSIIKYFYLYLTIQNMSNTFFLRGVTYMNFSLNKEIVVSLFFIVIVAIYTLKCSSREFRGVLLHGLLVFYYIPVNEEYALENVPLEFLVLVNLYFLFVIFALGDSKHLNKEAYKTNYKKTLFNPVLLALFCFACILFILYKFSYNGFDLSLSLSGEDVYSNRASHNLQRSLMSGTLLSYFIAMLENMIVFIAPIYLYISLIRRKKFSALLALLTILAEFSVSSQKGVLLFVFVVFGIYFCWRMNLLRKFKEIINYGTLAFLVLCILEKKLFTTKILYSLFIRRILYTPAFMNTIYYDFFKRGPKLLFSNSAILLQKFMPPVYNEPFLSLMNKEYFAGSIPSPNTGMFGEAYMQLGALGIIVFPILICVFSRVTENVLRQYGKGLSILVAVNLILSLMNIPILRTDFVLQFVFPLFFLWAVQKVKVNRSFICRTRSCREKLQIF